MTKGIGAAVVAVQEIARWSGGWPIKEQPMTNTERVALLPWPFFGYAPGNYTGICRLGCGETKDGLDKRAMRCLECAVVAAKDHIDSLEEHAACTDTIPNVDELVEALEEARRLLRNGTLAHRAETRRSYMQQALNTIDDLLSPNRSGGGDERCQSCMSPNRPCDCEVQQAAHPNPSEEE